MTPVDDLNVGQWITVIGHEIIDMYGGMPFEIRAIDLPFIAVRDASGKVGAIDARVTEMKVMSAAYVDAFRPGLDTDACRRTEATPLGNCDRCGQRLIQRLVDRKWVNFCRDCERVSSGG